MTHAPPIPVAAVELTIDDRPPALDPAERAAAAAGWAARLAANPALWNGPFFLFQDVVIEPGRAFRAVACPTDFATFLHWRADPAPDDRFAHVFPVAAVTSRDDRLLLGVMGPTTANAGLAYPPSGSFDDDDRVGAALDPLVNIRRELAEEVGIDHADLVAEPGWWVIGSGPRRFALVKRHRSALTAAELEARIAHHLATDGDGELSGVLLVPFDRPLPPERTVPYVAPLAALLAAVSAAA